MKTILKVIAGGIVWATVLSLSSIQSCKADELWVNTGGFSKHFEDNGRNEVNFGLGAEYRFRDDVSVMAGFHKNSLDLRTRYAAMVYQPWSIGNVKIGVSMGYMDGYPLKSQGKGFFAVLPMATYEGDRFGVNLGVIPNIPSQHVEGAVALQFKFKVF
jgi:outer membrane scaffolding protein for murein synthesis (MipA/OmpV family)